MRRGRAISSRRRAKLTHFENAILQQEILQRNPRNKLEQHNLTQLP